MFSVNVGVDCVIPFQDFPPNRTKTRTHKKWIYRREKWKGEIIKHFCCLASFSSPEFSGPVHSVPLLLPTLCLCVLSCIYSTPPFRTQYIRSPSISSLFYGYTREQYIVIIFYVILLLEFVRFWLLCFSTSKITSDWIDNEQVSRIAFRL